MKNRIHGVLNQYGWKNLIEEEDDVDVPDWFSRTAQPQFQRAIEQLPSAGGEATRQQGMAIQDLERRVKRLELAREARMGKLGWLRLLPTLPGVGKILGAAIGWRWETGSGFARRSIWRGMPGWFRRCSPAVGRPGGDRR